ncbi:MAG: YicC family protein [Chlamydiales bacterium]|nr:YicC family protein [Chlamydiales bacterium]
MMIRSMTAYARKTLQTKKSNITIEIFSLNRKNLDIHTILPKDSLKMEMPIRKKIGDFVKRGSITIRICIMPSGQLADLLPADEALLSMKKYLEQKRELLHVKESLSFPFILEECEKYRQAQEYTEEEMNLVVAELDEVINTWIEMKLEEGKALQQDIIPRLEEILNKLVIIEKLSSQSIVRFKEKIKKKIEEISLDIQLDEERIAKEVVFFADKIDINEEIVRLRSHVHQFQHTLNLAEVSVGKTLDFLVQEMHREINSLGVKSQELEISKLVIEAKSELEKIREQVQNIE